MAKIKNLEKIFLVIAIVVLLTGIYVTLYASTPVYEVEKPTGSKLLSPVSSMQGMITVNVIKEGETSEGV